MTENARSNIQALSNIRVILVNPSHPGNIGAVARAMKNMGLQHLTLVNPDKYPHPEAQWRAVSAVDVLDNAQVFATVEEAIADCQFVVGTSARSRRIPWPILPPRECAEQMVSTAGNSAKVAILFGREEHGLTNDELHSCHLHLSIPASEDYSSLNLAMAVQVVCYELRVAAETVRENAEQIMANDPLSEWDQPFATGEEMAHLYEHLERTMIDLGFLVPSRPRQLMPRLQRLFNRARLDEMEVRILRGLLSAIDNKGKKK